MCARRFAACESSSRPIGTQCDTLEIDIVVRRGRCEELPSEFHNADGHRIGTVHPGGLARAGGREQILFLEDRLMRFDEILGSARYVLTTYVCAEDRMQHSFPHVRGEFEPSTDGNASVVASGIALAPVYHGQVAQTDICPHIFATASAPPSLPDLCAQQRFFHNQNILDQLAKVERNVEFDKERFARAMHVVKLTQGYLDVAR